MPGDGLGAAAVSAAAAPTIAVVTALGFESGPLRRRVAEPTAPGAADAPLLIAQGGPGPARAAAAAAAAVERGAGALVAWGVAGALAADLSPGTVVLPRLILGTDSRRYAASGEWHAALIAVLRPGFDVVDAVLLSGDAVIGTPAAKARAAQQSGAAAVDMEAAGVARVAVAADVPFVAVRVIVDTAHDALPTGAERWVDEAGNRRWSAAVESAFRPGEWRVLWRLAQRYRRATRELHRLAEVLVPLRFGWPRPR